MVRIRAKHSSSIPIAMALCGNHSGVCSGVGATSSARHELAASRYNCQVTSADATSETKSKTICEISLAANDRRICTSSTRWNAPWASATDMLRNVSATSR